MEVDVAARNKAEIEEAIRNTVREYNGRDDIRTLFGEPVVSFVSAEHPLFDTFFARNENDHPKKIFRPGNTLIVHYVPWELDGAQGSAGVDGAQGSAGVDGAKDNDPAVSDSAWAAADRESLWLAMEINKNIKKTLDKVGRLHSSTSTMVDWDMEKHRYEWSNKIAAFIGGIGELGSAGSLHVNGKHAGRAGSVLTAALYAEVSPGTNLGGVEGSGADLRDPEELDRIFRDVMSRCRFTGWNEKPCREEMIAACPGGAISAEGIDRERCQQWCMTIDRYTPSPEVCGRCFGFK